MRDLTESSQGSKKHGLKLKPEKCKFLQFKVTYVGHQISSDGITIDKTGAVPKWKPSTTVKEVKSFLEFCRNYQRSVKDFARLLDHYTN